MKACECGSKEIVVLMLKAGADATIKDNRDCDAYNYAITNHPLANLHKIIEEYLKSGTIIEN